MHPIIIKIENTTVTLHPKAYTYEKDKDQDFCQIGIQTIKQGLDEYRFGAIFLRNFVTALDYDKDVITLGLTKLAKKHKTATIDGETEDPYVLKEEKSENLESDKSGNSNSLGNSLGSPENDEPGESSPEEPGEPAEPAGGDNSKSLVILIVSIVCGLAILAASIFFLVRKRKTNRSGSNGNTVE